MALFTSNLTTEGVINSTFSKLRVSRDDTSTSHSDQTTTLTLGFWATIMSDITWLWTTIRWALSGIFWFLLRCIVDVGIVFLVLFTCIMVLGLLVAIMGEVVDCLRAWKIANMSKYRARDLDEQTSQNDWGTEKARGMELGKRTTAAESV